MLQRPSEPPSANPLAVMWGDLAAERARTVPYPPGEHGFSMRRTNRFIDHPMRVLVDGYERFGPIYTLRIFHHNVVFMLGPEANHHVLVSGADNLSWRGGELRALIPLLGDGLLTTDGAYHRAHRKLMLPAFHRERIATAVSVMEDEVERAAAAFVPGAVIDVYAWTRDLALRVAMRALFGLDPGAAREPSGRLRRPVLPGGRSVAHEFETALSFHARSVAGQVARGPGSPYARVLRRAGDSTRCSSPRSTAAAPATASARTCSRCSSRHATRTATRSRASRSATRS